MFLTFFIYIYRFRNDLSVHMFLGNLSYCLVGLMAVYGVILLHYKRDAFSSVIDDVNGKNWNMLRRSYSLKYRSKRNRIHLICMGMYCLGSVSAFTVCPALLLEFIVTGEDHFKNHFTVGKPIYSFWPFVNCLINTFLCIWIVNFFTPVFIMILEIFLIISLNLRTLATDLRNIKVGGEESVRIFKSLMKELDDFQRWANLQFSMNFNSIRLVYFA